MKAGVKIYEEVRMAVIPVKNYVNIRRGQNHGRAKLLDSEVEHIRRMVESGEFTQKEVAAKFEISESHVHRLVTYKQR